MIDPHDLIKVTVSPGAATHVRHPTRDNHTLCGRRWWFECHLGTESYCEPCQVALAKLMMPEPS